MDQSGWPLDHELPSGAFDDHEHAMSWSRRAQRLPLLAVDAGL